MKKILLALGLFAAQFLYGQEDFSKYDVSDSGCSFHTFGLLKPVDKATDDNSTIYTAESEYGGYTYGLILARYNDPIPKDSIVRDGTLSMYVDITKDMMRAEDCTPPVKGLSLPNHPNATGWEGTCKLESGQTLYLKAWMDVRCVAVLYIHGTDVPNDKVKELFLNGIGFPQ